MYVGIDYGNNLTNKNQKTGIRFGVISFHQLDSSYHDESDIIYSNACPHCGNEPKSGKPINNKRRCPSCKKPLAENDFDYQEPIGYRINNKDYFTWQSVDTPDIFIERSPFFTYAVFCSPCAPGACDLSAPINEKLDNNKCYCFGHDFFESGKAPYTIYSVETGEIVLQGVN